MNENFKIKPLYYIAVIVIFVIVQYAMQRGNGTNTEATVSTIRQQQQGVTVEIANVDTRIGVARETTTEASKRIADGERIARESAERINSLSKLARECKEITEANRRIIDEVRTSNNAVKE